MQPTTAVTPRQIIRGELVLGTTLALVAALTVAIEFFLAYTVYNYVLNPPPRGFKPTDIADTAVSALWLGSLAGVAAWLTRSSARRYLVFILCSRGRLPRRLGAFLDHCCDAGLMRVSGSSYQFRHRELQHWLTAHPDPTTHNTDPLATPAHPPRTVPRPGGPQGPPTSSSLKPRPLAARPAVRPDEPAASPATGSLGTPASAHTSPVPATARARADDAPLEPGLIGEATAGTVAEPREQPDVPVTQRESGPGPDGYPAQARRELAARGHALARQRPDTHHEPAPLALRAAPCRCIGKTGSGKIFVAGDHLAGGGQLLAVLD
ncbi:hypothetical protein ACFRAR_28385 [Kitasatospora sp. NPDC056651]|uniref:hypothetical protein n=1 Tax=Kitasatospora sp. NPDC056651 TaxID=3345892 RepID=UPI0036C1B2ED